jgi:EAL domain-containing protein (putative c-di-GMP-specific phosphodiesterase class I)
MPGTYLSVNVSPLQLIEAAFPGQVREILHRHGFAPGRLVLEITENALADEAHMIETLNTLRRAGIRIAIDDFGTGYSSLRHLHRLPADIIKIDRSYIRDIADDDGTRRLVGTLHQLFTDLGLTVVVEGVEDERQARTLLDAGCRYAQGYLFSRPVPAVDLSPGYPHPHLHPVGHWLGEGS